MKTFSIESRALMVLLDKSFPRAIQYTWKKNGSVLHGQPKPISKIELVLHDGSNSSLTGFPPSNGWHRGRKKKIDRGPTKICEPVVRFKKKNSSSAVYKLFVKELNVTITAVFEVKKNVLSFTITDIKGKREKEIRYITIPDHGLLSVCASESGSSVAAVRTGFVNHQKEMFSRVSRMKPERKSTAWSYVMMNTRNLAGTVWNNVLLDRERFFTRISNNKTLGKSCSLSCAYWTWREIPGEKFEHPTARVVITTDINGDGKVDWQDAALAYRSIDEPPLGADLVRERISSQIAMNFASWAQNPFLRVLDAMKKVYLYTDGLGQDIQFKGFAAEGHDSSHPDYGGNVNQRAGGRDELNFVMKRGKDFNARSGIHINVTEYYPEAKNFSEDLVDRKRYGWAWLDQSYLVDGRYDLISGELYKRLDQMNKTLPYLDWVYVDVYWGQGWDAYKLAHKINSLGLPIYTEFEGFLERHVTWNHRSQDWTQRVWGDGINSRIIRLMQNHQRDIFTHTPLLRGSQNDGFLGWHSQRNIRDFIRSVFTCNLPSKYLQHFPMLSLEKNKAVFEKGVTSVVENGVSKIYRDGILVNSAVYPKRHRPPTDNMVFIPWNPLKPSKIYHWNDKGGTSTWTLPDSWKGVKKVKLYRLTDLGRVFVENLKVKKNRVSPRVKPATPYVIYRSQPRAVPEIKWGEGSPVKDPGFDSHSFKYWKLTSGTEKDVRVENDEMGQTHLCISGKNGGVVKQKISLEPGKWYSASVWIEITGRKPAALIVTNGRKKVLSSVSIDKSDVMNYSDNASKYLTRYQRVKTTFRAPEKTGTVTLSLAADKGTPGSVARFDDVRVVQVARPNMRGHYFFENFENVDEGWGPFVYGYKGSMRTHLAETNRPYTNDTIEGQFSLKSFDEEDGLNFRTLPSLLKLKPNTRYKLSFDYLTWNNEQYSVTVVSDDGGIGSSRLFEELPGEKMRRRKFSSIFTTGKYEDYYIGFIKNFSIPHPWKKRKRRRRRRKRPGKWRETRGILVIDNFAVDELK